MESLKENSYLTNKKKIQSKIKLSIEILYIIKF